MQQGQIDAAAILNDLIESDALIQYRYGHGTAAEVLALSKVYAHFAGLSIPKRPALEILASTGRLSINPRNNAKTHTVYHNGKTIRAIILKPESIW